jgi:peroxiredoxin
MSVQPGEPAPDVTFVGTDGGSVPLAAFRGKPLVLVFLRHLA